MKDEYDFSKGQRGKFYRPEARMNLPVYLDEDVRRYLQDRADAKGVSLSEMVMSFSSRTFRSSRL
jgi:hypothetical protein